MKINLLLAALAATVSLSSCAVKQPKPAFEANWESLSTHEHEPEWFKDAKLGIYYHWGPYTVPACFSEWYPRHMYLKDVKSEFWGKDVYEYHRKTYGDDFEYHDFIPMLTAEKFDAKDWAKLFKDAGARFAGPVAEHHDGFAMWDSDVNPWNAMDMGPKRDVTGEVLAELKKEGLRTITTFHHARTGQRYATDTLNWGGVNSHYPYDPEMVTSTTDPKLKYLYGNLGSDKEINDYWLAQVNEVVDKYSPDIIWFDSWLDVIPENYRQEMVAHQFNAGAARNDVSLVVRKQDDIPANLSIIDVEQGGMIDMPDTYWMTDITLSFGAWCYTNGQVYKPLDLLLRNMIDVWSKRGIVLLNISPDAHGVICDAQREVLLSLGSWLKKYGEAIYTSRVYSIYGYGDAAHEEGEFGGQSATMQYSASDVRFTTSKDGKKLYAITLGMPTPESELTLRHITPTAKKVSVLGSDAKIEWKQDGENITLTTPAASEMDVNATVFVIE